MSRGTTIAMHFTRTTLAFAAATAALVATTAPAQAGGLAVSPSTIERGAQAGSLGDIRVSNGSDKTISVTVRARPWIQTRTGAVRPDSSRRLASIRLGASAFDLAPGAARVVPAALLSTPKSGSLYGTIDVVGTPQGPPPKNGVRTRYRLLAGLRLNPAAAQRKLGVGVGAARYSAGNTLVTVRNNGNTVEPITGTATITGPSGTHRASFVAQRILPHAAVDMRLPQGRLAAGKYKVALVLTQGGRQVAKVARSMQVPKPR